MSARETWPDTPNATSLPALEDGASHCAWRAGQTLDLFGPAPALANLSARQAKERGLLTSGTYGRPSSTSSSSAALQSSLESRLRALMGSGGSTLYELTWKQRATPQGLPICALRGLARRTSDSGSTGWPTAAARDWKGATLERWGTNARPLNEVAVLCGWPTPTSALADKGVRTFEGGLIEAMRNHGPDLAAAVCLTGWPTPVVNDSTGSDYAYSRGNHDKVTLKLGGTAKLTGWPTPNTMDTIDRKQMRPSRAATGRETGYLTEALVDYATPGPARLTASGDLLTGSHAAMESGGQLNPAHSRWLQGYPGAWCLAAILAHRSMSTKRRKVA